MSILVLSPHKASAAPLCSALERRQIPFHWQQDVPLDHETPLVAVVDSRLKGYGEALQTLKLEAPWCRRYLLDPPHGENDHDGTSSLMRPFDASLVAERLGRECELAQIDRRRHELELEAQNLGELLQNSFEAFIGLNQALEIVSFSPGASEMYGYSAAGVLGKPGSGLGDGIPGDSDAPESRMDLGSPLESGKVVLETSRRHANGRLLRVLVSRSRTRRGGVASALAYTEVSLDLTPLRRLEEQLEHQGRLAHLGKIAATMSHEINNPLSVIQSAATWFQTFAQETHNDEFQEVARDLVLASTRIATFVRQISGFVRNSTSDMQLKPLAGTVEMALRMLRPRAADKGVSLSVVEAGGATLIARHDPSRFAHAIINIVANAIDSAADGGCHVWLSVTVDTNAICIRVDDDGPGISETIQDRLFELFATTKAPGHGTGIGLALTREIVTEHAGSVSLVNREPNGARAVILLPLPKTRPEPEAESPGA